MRYTLVAIIFIFFNLKSVASEEFEDQPLGGSQGVHYYETRIDLLELNGTGHYTPSYYNERNKIAETAEVAVYDYDSPTLIGRKTEDGTYEVIEKKEKLKEKSFEKKPHGKEIFESPEFKISTQKLKQKDTQLPPYKLFGNLLVTFPQAEDGTRLALVIGSGALIGPNHVLTAAHTIYDHKRGGWAQHVIFTPAQHNQLKPFTEAKGNIIRVPKGWIRGEKDKEDYDIGMIILERAIGYQIGWASLLIPNEAFFPSCSKLIIVGYPYNHMKVKQQEGVMKVARALMYKHSGKLEKWQANRLIYHAQTSVGQSGGPILVYINKLHYY
ncbi:MAG: trypsin-like serine protease, partial [Alphaproteobacteria bacterium]|nr:trypsin-like serine protease [Alphaproteobacteria bacterium]